MPSLHAAAPMVVATMLLALLGVDAQSSPSASALTLNAPPLPGEIPPAEWKDYFVVADNDDYNLVFQVNATSDYANAIGIYLSEELPPLDDRFTPGQFLDFDAYSMIVVDGVRQYSIVLAQCYIRRGQTYYLSVFGKNVGGSVSKPTVAYSVAVSKVPARIALGSTVTGTVCDGHYLHYYWEVDSSLQSGGVRTEVRKLEGDLDASYMRYEKCAGLASANLATVPLEGHGQPSGSVILPQGIKPLEEGRYYVSIKAKPEICGEFTISPSVLTQSQLLSSPGVTWRRGGLFSLLASLASTLLLGHAIR